MRYWSPHEVFTKRRSVTQIPNKRARLMERTCSSGSDQRLQNCKTLPTLPQEILDLLLDNLHADEATLRSCALVSSAWVPTSRYHVFHQLDIQGRIRDTSFATFIDLLESPFCTFSHHVRCLSVSGAFEKTPWNSWMSNTLPAVVARLPRLQALRCSSLDVSELLSLGPLTSHPDFTLRMTTLRLQAVTFDQFEDIFHLISSFRNLHTLEWKSWYRMTREEEATWSTQNWAGLGQVPSSLRVVDVSPPMPCNWSIWRWLLDCQAFDVNTVKVRHLDRIQVPSLAIYLGRLGERLDYLQMTVSARDQLRYFIDDIDLRHNESLRRLEIKSTRTFAFAKNPVTLDLELLPRLFLRLPDSLEHLHCILTNENDVYCRVEAIKTLDGFFQHPRLLRLRSIQIDYEGKRAEARERLKALLCSSIQAGLVSVSS